MPFDSDNKLNFVDCCLEYKKIFIDRVAKIKLHGYVFKQ